MIPDALAPLWRKHLKTFADRVKEVGDNMDLLQQAYDWWIGMNSPWTVADIETKLAAAEPKAALYDEHMAATDCLRIRWELEKQLAEAAKDRDRWWDEYNTAAKALSFYDFRRCDAPACNCGSYHTSRVCMKPEVYEKLMREASAVELAVNTIPRDCFDHADNCCAEWCQRCKDSLARKAAPLSDCARELLALAKVGERLKDHTCPKTEADIYVEWERDEALARAEAAEKDAEALRAMLRAVEKRSAPCPICETWLTTRHDHRPDCGLAALLREQPPAAQKPDMSKWPQYRDERLCPHGVGHPEPGKPHHGDGTHGCDGCCIGEGPGDA